MRRVLTVSFCVLVLIMSLFASAAIAEDPYNVVWSHQLGTSTGDISYSVAVDASGNVFISGETSGGLGRPDTDGIHFDAFLAKYDPAGNLLWIEQLGTNEWDGSYSVAMDASGNAFISGGTYGNLGGPSAGGGDAFLAKYDPNGNLLWIEQLGTSGSDGYGAVSIAVDGSGNAFISGFTSGSLGGANAGYDDAFLAKYDPNGNLLWTEQLGTSATDHSYSVAVDASGNAFISGETYGSLGGTNAGNQDAFLAKYDPNGNLFWIEQLGTSKRDRSRSVAVDSSGNAFISGYTFGSLGGTNAGNFDVFLAKYDPNGNLLWTEQLGTSDEDVSSSVAVDASGNAFISGYTFGSLGETNAGGADAFWAKYDPNGNLLWTEQVGTSDSDSSNSVAIDASGNAFISGDTRGSLGGPNAGSNSLDAFLIKFAPCDYVVIGDVDGNCKVDFRDVAEMAGNWLIDCFANSADPACVAKP